MPALSLIAIDIVKFYGDRKIFDGLNLAAHPGQRLGLVGENGAGKSTLLRLLAGTDTPDAGDISRPTDTGLLHQELPYTPQHTVADVINEALAESRTLLNRLDTLAEQLTRQPDDPDLLSQYGHTLHRAEQSNAWDAERRAEQTRYGLGLATIGLDRTLGTISGGQRSRVALAALLIRQPGALLLDEPTNHLDDQAITFLETQLRQLPGVVILASHDRVLLDEVCTDIVDLDPTRRSPAVKRSAAGDAVDYAACGGPTRYGGSYTTYLSAKQAERARWEQTYAEQQDELESLRVAVRTTARQVAPDRPIRDRNKMAYGTQRGRVEASVSSRVRAARHRLELAERNQVRKPPPVLHFRAPTLTSATSDEVAATVHQLHVPGRLRLSRLDLPADGRLLITGPNGSGKSTLLAVLSGAVNPGSSPGMTGNVSRRPGLRVGLLTQDDDYTDLDITPRELYQRAGEPAVPLEDLGLIPPRDLDRPLGQLSVGQRRRVSLATLIAHPPHVLLLDEPTNHLSLTLADELEQALGTAPGAVVIASHDRWLRRRWTSPTLHLG